MTSKPTPVLRVHPPDIAARALVVGDPHRALQAAELLENARKVGENRSYITFTGDYKGQSITICSHGVGGPSASICFTELFLVGVETIIRAGTCGALRSNIDVGDLVIGHAAIREDGTTPQFIPLEYPAAANPHVVLALEQAARHCKVHRTHGGVVLTQAHLYPGVLPSTIDLWIKAGAVCVEMELATLLVMASLQGKKAGGIFTVDGNLVKSNENELTPEKYDPHQKSVQQGVQRMLEVAFEALLKL